MYTDEAKTIHRNELSCSPGGRNYTNESYIAYRTMMGVGYVPTVSVLRLTLISLCQPIANIKSPFPRHHRRFPVLIVLIRK
jgi:hypothetical protein